MENEQLVKKELQDFLETENWDLEVKRVKTCVLRNEYLITGFDRHSCMKSISIDIFDEYIDSGHTERRDKLNDWAKSIHNCIDKKIQRDRDIEKNKKRKKT